MTVENIAKISIASPNKLIRSNSNSSIGSTQSEVLPSRLLNMTANLTAVCIHGKNEGILTELVDRYLEICEDWENRIAKRRNYCSTNKLFMGLCTDKYIQSMKQRATKKRVTAGWTSKSNKSSIITPATLGMAIEEYHSSLLELSTCIEEGMACIHQALLQCIKNVPTNQTSTNTDSKHKSKSSKLSLKNSNKSLKSMASNVNLSVHYALSNLLLVLVG